MATDWRGLSSSIRFLAGLVGQRALPNGSLGIFQPRIGDLTTLEGATLPVSGATFFPRFANSFFGGLFTVFTLSTLTLGVF